MRIITLWQPWASLMVMGVKRVETRPRNFNHKGELGIHAAKFKNQAFAELCKRPPFDRFITDYYALPFGAIIGKVNVKGCCSTDFIVKHHDLIEGIVNWEIEKEFGNYDTGRSGIVCSDHEQFEVITPAKGFQTMPWKFDDNKLLHLKKSTV